MNNLRSNNILMLSLYFFLKHNEYDKTAETLYKELNLERVFAFPSYTEVANNGHNQSKGNQNLKSAFQNYFYGVLLSSSNTNTENIGQEKSKADQLENKEEMSYPINSMGSILEEGNKTEEHFAENIIDENFDESKLNSVYNRDRFSNYLGEEKGESLNFLSENWRKFWVLFCKKIEMSSSNESPLDQTLEKSQCKLSYNYETLHSK
mmetsp:Transcript_29178/g.30300  ORF Transcript_29178/g.30300 Transcript_29178/m.30300 type:complete len:207 (+) Transcript_29178:45-665(+)